MENIEEKFGAVVRSLRLAAGLTQEQLAQALTQEGWATRQNTIAKLENGMRPTTMPELAAIARVFDMSPRDIGALTWPPAAEDEDETRKFAWKHDLALKRTQLRTSQRELASLELEAQQLRNTISGLEKDVRDLEEELGEHSEEG